MELILALCVVFGVYLQGFCLEAIGLEILSTPLLFMLFLEFLAPVCSYAISFLEEALSNVCLKKGLCSHLRIEIEEKGHGGSWQAIVSGRVELYMVETSLSWSKRTDRKKGANSLVGVWLPMM